MFTQLRRAGVLLGVAAVSEDVYLCQTSIFGVIQTIRGNWLCLDWKSQISDVNHFIYYICCSFGVWGKQENIEFCGQRTPRRGCGDRRQQQWRCCGCGGFNNMIHLIHPWSSHLKKLYMQNIYQQISMLDPKIGAPVISTKQSVITCRTLRFIIRRLFLLPVSAAVSILAASCRPLSCPPWP